MDHMVRFVLFTLSFHYQSITTPLNKFKHYSGCVHFVLSKDVTRRSANIVGARASPAEFGCARPLSVCSRLLITRQSRPRRVPCVCVACVNYEVTVRSCACLPVLARTCHSAVVRFLRIPCFI